MIQLPRRSVTRFFIPLVDVMMLLFCIFLLMPIIKTAAKTAEAEERDSLLVQAQQDREALERELQRRTQELERLEQLTRTQLEVERLKSELERLKLEKINTLQQRLLIRVLEIDPNNGNLVFYDAGLPPRRRLITSQQAANELIAEHRQLAAGKELYYLFLFPRQDSAFPTEGQFAQYRRWFAQVAYGIDRPTR